MSNITGNEPAMPEETQLKQAVSILCEALRNDPEYFYSWQSNIAMAFRDEFDAHKARNGSEEKSEVIHHISNQSAINFLNLLAKIPQ